MRIGRFRISAFALFIAVSMMLVCTGVVFAATYYTVHTTTASLTVEEAFTVDQWAGDSWESCSPTFPWIADVHPGETVTQLLRVNNAGTAPLTAHVTEITGSIVGVGDYAVPGLGDSGNIPLSWTVPDSTAPGTYTFTINITGGSGGGGGGSTQHVNPFTISHIAGTGVWYESIWTINAYPGETNFITLRVSNSNHVSLIAYANVSGNCSTIYGAGNYTVPANGFKDITFTLVVNSSAIPKIYVSYITISQ